MDGVEVGKDLPWQESDDAQVTVIAAGLWVSAEVARCQSQATRIQVEHPWGSTAVHHWRPAHANGLKPLVLFHGGSGSWTHWVKNISALVNAGHDVWALDLPGFGDSDAPPKVVDADGMLPVLAEILQSLFPLQSVRLMGFSFGGMTAAMLAAQYPYLVEQLVLIGAPGMGLATSRPFRLKGWRHLQGAKEQLLHHVYNLGVLMVHDRDSIDRDMVGLHVANVRKDKLPRRRLSSTDILVQSLRRVECPVAAVYGEKDVLYPSALNEVAACMAAISKRWLGLQRVADAGHWVQYERPQEFLSALSPLLRF